MTFPVALCRYESWAVKKAKHWRIDAFELWCWRRLLRVSWTARRSNLKEINPEYSLEELMLKLSSNTLATWYEEPNSLVKPPMLGKIEGRKRRGRRRRRHLDGVIDTVDVSLSRLWEIVKNREAWCAAVHGVQRVRHDLATEQWTTRVTSRHWP